MCIDMFALFLFWLADKYSCHCLFAVLLSTFSGGFVDDFSIEELAGPLNTRKLWSTSSEDPCVNKSKQLS